MSALPRPFRLLPLLALLGMGGGHAATVNVQVSAAAGPLTDAVVMLEPAAGRLPVKPMSGVEIAQAQKQFQPRVTVVTVGTPVSFPNFDTVRHHVYSFSPIKTFELKLYAGVPREPVVFDKPGVAVLGCNIHDQMAGWVVVVDTPLFARSDA
jgi:plastocyanin